MWGGELGVLLGAAAGAEQENHRERRPPQVGTQRLTSWPGQCTTTVAEVNMCLSTAHLLAPGNSSTWMTVPSSRVSTSLAPTVAAPAAPRNPGGAHSTRSRQRVRGCTRMAASEGVERV